MKLAKRISIALLAACVVGGAAFAMTACGGGEQEPVDSAPPVAADAGVQTYLNRADVQAELQKQISAVRTEGDMALRVAVEGSNFVYTYTLLHLTTEEPTAAEVEAEFAGVRAELEANQSAFVNLIREIRTDAGVTDPNVIVRYETSTGRVIYELTFTETEVLQTVPAT